MLKNDTPHTITLYYVHDPMCAWCFAFQRSLQALIANLPPNVKLVKLLGGLAPDSSEPMTEPMKLHIINNWRRIESTVEGIRFNYDFWKACEPRRSTYLACRAVIAARMQGESFEDKMIDAIQMAYYTQARNPSDAETLLYLAKQLGLTTQTFELDLVSAHTNQILMENIQRARARNARTFPSLVLEKGGAFGHVNVDYNTPDAMIRTIEAVATSRQ